MPYRWTDDTRELTLWPHRSMTNTGFVTFIGATSAFLAVPLLATLGSPVLWAILPFMAVAVGGVWLALNRSDRDARMTEVLTLSPQKVALVRREAKGEIRTWDANPYWVSVHLHPGEKPVEKYLTLRGNGREVELGAFLSPDERQTLYGELRLRLPQC